MSSFHDNAQAATPSACTIITATLGRSERAATLHRAVDSVLETNAAPLTILIVVNGDVFDPELVAALERRPDIRVLRIAQRSFANAILAGRREVRTPYFGFLDDDDEYLPGAIDRRLATLEADATADVIVTNGFRRSVGKESRAFNRLHAVEADPLGTLFCENWLASCGALFRTSSVPLSLFEDYHEHVEWTWFAFKLVNAGLKIRVNNEPSFVINESRDSASKSLECLASVVTLYQRVLASPQRPEIRALLRRRLSMAHHSLSSHELEYGSRIKAWRHHLRSLAESGGWRHARFSLRLIAASLGGPGPPVAMKPDQGIAKPVSIARGAALTVGARWIDRFIGIASTIILARLLVPEDFGIVAIASLAIGLADTLLDLGVNVALIQNRNATQSHYDTGWTVRLAQTSMATLLLIVAAPYIADYFQDERLRAVIRALAFVLLLAGLENIGIIAFQKNMQFGAETRFLVIKRIAGFATTILAAIMLRSYWALVLGALTGRAIGVGLSYWVHPMRPRISLVAFREIFAVSQWILVRNLGAFLYNNLHKLMVARWSSAATMGAYTLADEIAEMPAAELMAPLNRVLLPAFAAAKEDLVELKRLFLLAQGVQTLLVVPAAIGLALVADELVAVLLGHKWMAAIPFLKVLAVVAVTHALTTAGAYVLLAMNRVRLSALSLWIEVSVIAAIGYSFLSESDAIYMAWLRLGAAMVGVGLSFALVLHALPGLRLAELLKNTARPLLATAVMSIAVLSVDAVLLPPIVALIAKTVVGAIVFTAAVLGVWWLAGRPVGAESYLLAKSTEVRDSLERRFFG